MDRHDVIWTPEKIKFFWDYISENSSLAGMYFTKENGKGVAQHLSRKINLNGKSVLDFGCGPGNLFPFLIKQAPEVEYFGLDFSSTSIAQLKSSWETSIQLKGGEVIKSFPTAIDKNFDVIVCCEVIEHLDDTTLENVCSEFYRLLKPGGQIYITTPNDEELDLNKVMCPECGGIFHRWQHMRTWNAATLTDYMAKFKFKKSETQILTFDNNMFRGRIKTVVKRVIGRKIGNLCYIGTRDN